MISQQAYIKLHQYESMKRAWTNFNEDLYLKILTLKTYGNDNNINDSSRTGNCFCDLRNIHKQ